MHLACVLVSEYVAQCVTACEGTMACVNSSKKEMASDGHAC